MSEFQRGTTFTTGVESAAQLHALIEGAKILPGSITEKTEATRFATGDYISFFQAASNAMRKMAITPWLFAAGDVLPTAASAVGAGWLLCNGEEYLQSAYPDLFAAIGSAYGSATSGHFRVPDLRGRGIIGLDSLVSAAYADRVTNSGAGNPGIDARMLGASGGADRRTITTNELPAHVHSVFREQFIIGAAELELGATQGKFLTTETLFGTPVNSGSAGSGTPLAAQPPSIVLNFKIKT